MTTPPHAARTLDEKLARMDWFAGIMKQRLVEEERAGRDEWDTWTVPQIFNRALECLTEAMSAVAAGLPPDDVIRAYANAANYCGIVSDLVAQRGLGEARCLLSPAARPA